MGFGQIWNFLWNEDSLLSWIVNIILAFVIIKFLVYPGLGLALGTSHPIVAVVSGSMEHDGEHPCEELENGECVEYDEESYEICGNRCDVNPDNNLDNYWKCCGEWYGNRNINKEEFNSYDFKNGFNKGDIMIINSLEGVEKGDVIVYWSERRSSPIIHRVVDIKDNGTIFETKGDNNKDQIPPDENIHRKNVIGKALLKVPYLGWVKIWFVNFVSIFV